MRSAASRADRSFRRLAAVPDRSLTLNSPVWSVPSSWPTLKVGEIHVWAFDAEAGAFRLEEFECLLSADEMARAARFRFEHDREGFVGARGLLRSVLGRYADCTPESLHFLYSEFGKPSLSPATGKNRLRFNASGSDSIALIAVRLDAEVGIDIERVRSMPDALSIANRMLTNKERDELASLPEQQRETRFFDYWVRKEALVKSLGRGLGQSFDALSLNPWPGEAQQQVNFAQDGKNVSQWVMPVTAPKDGFVAALATAIPVVTVKNWLWDGSLRDRIPT